MNDLLWLVPLLPLLGALINGVAGCRLSKGAVAGIACGLPIAAFGISLWAWGQGEVASSAVYWIPGIEGGDLALRADSLSILMMLVVTGVGSLIHVYSIGYMKDDAGFARYFCYLNLFMFAMLVLVMADNLLLMFVGWEGVGLCSYLLIGFWFEDGAKADAGKKAFIVNRIGDLGFILGMFLIAVHFGSVQFEAMKSAVLPSEGVLTAAALLLFVGACGKSAQIPLYVWLPDAMAGPTPVSALIHAATMVTAGVYMMCRLDFIFAYAPPIVPIVAAATALFAAVIALKQYDIKKVLAYSTVSQLGYMICGASVGATGAAMSHLATHAFFKALLFLGAGAVIVACHHEQDIRKMGGLWRKIPLIGAVFLVGTLSMGGPLAGMWSKGAIVEAVHERSSEAWILLEIAAFLTPFYIMRLFVKVFLGPSHGHEVHPVPAIMTAPLVVLAALSIVPIVGWDVIHFDLAHFAVSAAAFVLGYGVALKFDVDKYIPRFVENKFYVDEIYDFVVVRPLKMAATGLQLVVDRFVIDYGLVEGPPRAIYRFGRSLSAGHVGSVNVAVGGILLGALAAFAIVVYYVMHG